MLKTNGARMHVQQPADLLRRCCDVAMYRLPTMAIHVIIHSERTTQRGENRKLLGIRELYFRV